MKWPPAGIVMAKMGSSAVVTSVKYEHDIQQVSGVLMILKKWENNRTEETSLVTPTYG